MIKSEQAVTVLFCTSHPTTGAAADADATPVGTLYVNGTADAATVTETNITTGLYKAAVTLPTLTAGDIVSLRIAATVAGVAGEAIVWQDVGDTSIVSDVAATIDAFSTDEEVAEAVRAEMDDNSTQLAAIVLDTAEIGAAGAGLTAILDILGTPADTDLATDIAALPTAAEIKTEIEAAGSSLASILEDTGTTLDGKLDTIDGIVDDILEDTATTLPATLETIDNFLDTEVAAILEDTATTLPATLASMDTKLDTIDNFLDTEVALILEDTGTTIPGVLTTIEGKLDTVDAVADAIQVVTDAIGTTGTGLSAVPWNAAWDTEVQSECTDALNAYDPPTKAELDAADDTTLAAIAALDEVVDTVKVDTEAILEDTGTTLDGMIDLLIADKFNKLVVTDNEDGTITAIIYDTDGSTPLKTRVFTTASGTRAAAT